MKAQEKAVSINRAENRFELEISDKLSFITYFPRDEYTLVLTNMEVYPSLEGKGIGSQLILGALDYIEKYHLKIIPLCTSIADYLRRHPEYNRLLSPEYNRSLSR